MSKVNLIKRDNGTRISVASVLYFRSFFIRRKGKNQCRYYYKSLFIKEFTAYAACGCIERFTLPTTPCVRDNADLLLDERLAAIVPHTSLRDG